MKKKKNQIKQKNNLLNVRCTYTSPPLPVEEIIQRLTPIIQYQQRECTLEYIINHGQAEHINNILKSLKTDSLKEKECTKYGLDPNLYTFPKKKTNKTKKNKDGQKTNNWIANKLDENYEIKDISTTVLFKYTKLLHSPQDDSYMSLLKKYTKDGKEHAERWSLSTQEIKQLQRFEGEYELYYSVNSFFCAGRHSSKYVKRLNALFIDLDYYNIPELKDLSASEVFNKIKSEIDFPQESFVISSGAGLYIIWLLQTTYATDASKKYWSSIEQVLINKFKPYGADERVKDPARVLRVVGSKNSKNDATVQIISNKNLLENPLRYELSDFSNFFNEENGTRLNVKTNKVKKKPNKIFKLKNLLTLNYARTTDIAKLVELRHKQSQEGHREYLLFLYRLHLLYANVDEEQSLEMTLALNNNLYDPLGDDEVITKTACAVTYANNYKDYLAKYTPENGSLNDYLSKNNCYIYKNISIIRLLNISEAEQIHMATLIDIDEKKRRKNLRNKEYFSNPENVAKYNKGRRERYYEQLKQEDKLTREEKVIQTKAGVERLLRDGLSQRDIAAKLGVSQPTVSKYVKLIQIKEESLVS